MTYEDKTSQVSEMALLTELRTMIERAGLNSSLGIGDLTSQLKALWEPPADRALWMQLYEHFEKVNACFQDRVGTHGKNDCFALFVAEFPPVSRPITVPSLGFEEKAKHPHNAYPQFDVHLKDGVVIEGMPTNLRVLRKTTPSLRDLLLNFVE